MTRVETALGATALAAAAFLGGVFAPSSLAQRLHDAARALMGRPSAIRTASAASAPATPACVPMASLIVPSVPPANAAYALQAGQFAAREAADQLSASLSAQGVTSTVVLTADSRGTIWAVVALGQFGSVEEAQSQRNYLANKLGLQSALPVIVLPPAKPAS